jgi:ATP-dependent helicase IRC3
MFDLRPYQAEALAAVRLNHAAGVTRQLVALPTGAGKTVVFSSLAHARGPNALIIAHRSELITQAAAKLELFYPGQVGILQADRREIDAPVLVASIQSAKNHIAALAARGDRTLIIDEAHHAAAVSYRALAQALGFLAGDRDRLLLGVTATPRRGDGITLSCMFQKITYKLSILELMSQGYLADLRGIHVKTKTDLNKVGITAGDFTASELAQAINTPTRNLIIARALQRWGQVPAVAFCADVQHSLDLAAVLTAEGFKAAAVSGMTPAPERDRILTQLAAGDLDVVTNCNVLTEGFDCPALRCLLMARPTKSSALYTQMLGRGTRLHPGKTECIILEFSDNRPEICTLATLAGMPIKEGESIKEARARREYERQASQAPERVLSVIVEPFDLFKRSRFGWYQNEAGRWILKTRTGYIVIMQNKAGRWSVGSGGTWYSKWPGFKTLAEAFELGEEIAAQKIA